MVERAQALGGALRLGRSRLGGLAVRARLPVDGWVMPTPVPPLA